MHLFMPIYCLFVGWEFFFALGKQEGCVFTEKGTLTCFKEICVNMFKRVSGLCSSRDSNLGRNKEKDKIN